MSNNRKDWLNKFGGIKLFRDNFRVRPYGEAKDAAFDWLSLGNRKAASPAGVAKPEGGYRVEPENEHLILAWPQVDSKQASDLAQPVVLFRPGSDSVDSFRI